MTKTEPSAAPDVISRTVPSTSSTSDMPGAADAVTAKAPPTSEAPAKPEAKPVSEQTPAKSGEGSDNSGEGDGKGAETPAAEAKPEGDGKKPKPGINERFSDLTRDKKDALAKASAEEEARKAADARADKLAAGLATALEAINKVVPPAPEDVRPTRAQFDDPDKYDEALAGWAQRIGEKKAKAEAEANFAAQTEAEKKKNTEQAQKAEAERIGTAWKERVDTFVKENADFEDVIKNDDVQITPIMGQAILASESGPKLAYYLGKNPEEAAKIAALAPAMQLMRLGALETQLNAPPKTTKAPDPITPINRGANPANEKTVHEMDMSEYAAKRQVELRQGRPGKG